MTPLGRGLLTGMTEIDDPDIRDAMNTMLTVAPATEVQQTLLDLVALSTALCTALGDCSNTSPQAVLDCVLAR